MGIEISNNHITQSDGVLWRCGRYPRGNATCDESEYRWHSKDVDDSILDGLCRPDVALLNPYSKVRASGIGPYWAILVKLDHEVEGWIEP